MTATLAAELDTAAAHMEKVRDEYARTKADHAHVDGCDECAVGADFDRLAGWAFVAGRFLCSPCAFEARRVAKVVKRAKCVNGHALTEDNLFTAQTPAGARRTRCLQCRRDRSRNYKARERAAGRPV